MPLNTYNTKNQKMRFIEITPQQTNTHRREKPTPTTRVDSHAGHECRLDARNHYPRIKHHTPPPSGATTRRPPSPGSHPPPRTASGARACCLRTQQCVWQSPCRTGVFPPMQRLSLMHQTGAHYRRPAIQRIARITELPHHAGGFESRGAP